MSSVSSSGKSECSRNDSVIGRRSISPTCGSRLESSDDENRSSSLKHSGKKKKRKHHHHTSKSPDSLKQRHSRKQKKHKSKKKHKHRHHEEEVSPVAATVRTASGRDRESGGGDVVEWEGAMETTKVERNPESECVPNEVLVNDGLFVCQQQDQMTVGVASLITSTEQ